MNVARFRIGKVTVTLFKFGAGCIVVICFFGVGNGVGVERGLYFTSLSTGVIVRRSIFLSFRNSGGIVIDGVLTVIIGVVIVIPFAVIIFQSHGNAIISSPSSATLLWQPIAGDAKIITPEQNVWICPTVVEIFGFCEDRMRA